ncbi:MAG: hypothetical protein WCJ72_04990 [Chryseobacterium sp.]
MQQSLYYRGYSQIFNWEDYHYYKEITRDEIFRAESITELFIKDTCELSDYAEYEN